MQENVNEIEKVLQIHGYSINTIISDVMKTFSLKSLCHQVGFRKSEGYSTTEIFALMIMFPLMLLKSVHSFYQSQYQNVTEMKKDAIYRLKNYEKMPWRSLLLGIAKQFQNLVNPCKEVATNSAFIIDDTTDARVGKKIENISTVYDLFSRLFWFLTSLSAAVTPSIMLLASFSVILIKYSRNSSLNPSLLKQTLSPCHTDK